MKIYYVLCSIIVLLFFAGAIIGAYQEGLAIPYLIMIGLLALNVRYCRKIGKQNGWNMPLVTMLAIVASIPTFIYTYFNKKQTSNLKKQGSNFQGLK